jgi:hypothetical protein
MGQSRPTEEIVAELEANLHSRIISMGMAQWVTQVALKKHIAIPSKDNNFLSSFLVTLKNDMEILSQDVVMYEVTLEDLLFKKNYNCFLS